MERRTKKIVFLGSETYDGLENCRTIKAVANQFKQTQLVTINFIISYLFPRLDNKSLKTQFDLILSRKIIWKPFNHLPGLFKNTKWHLLWRNKGSLVNDSMWRDRYDTSEEEKQQIDPCSTVMTWSSDVNFSWTFLQTTIVGSLIVLLLLILALHASIHATIPLNQSAKFLKKNSQAHWRPPSWKMWSMGIQEQQTGLHLSSTTCHSWASESWEKRREMTAAAVKPCYCWG